MVQNIQDRIHCDSCIICGSGSISRVLSTKDFTITQESFEIWECANCSLRFTQDAPRKESIGRYYHSEDYISHSDTRKGLVNSLYHSIRKITLPGKRKLIQKHSHITKGALLDFGCGTGAFLHTMQESGWQVKGVEPDESARKNAETHYQLNIDPPENIFEWPPAQFDVITLWHVLEHVYELRQYLGRINHLLKPDGRIFIAVPNYTSADAKYYREAWAAYDTPRHLYHFSPTAMRRLLAEMQFKLIDIQPMWFDSYYVSMLSERNKNGRINYPSAVWQGWKSNRQARQDPELASSLIYICAKDQSIHAADS